MCKPKQKVLTLILSIIKVNNCFACAMNKTANFSNMLYMHIRNSKLHAKFDIYSSYNNRDLGVQTDN